MLYEIHSPEQEFFDLQLKQEGVMSGREQLIQAAKTKVGSNPLPIVIRTPLKGEPETQELPKVPHEFVPPIKWAHD